MRLAKERILQKAQARREANACGKWKEKLEPGTCACCPEPDRERDNHKRAIAEQAFDGGKHGLGQRQPLRLAKSRL